MSIVNASAGRPGDFKLSDEWFTEYIHNLERSTVRRRKLWRERVVIPVSAELARRQEQETEMLRRQIVVERERWLREKERTA